MIETAACELTQLEAWFYEFLTRYHPEAEFQAFKAEYLKAKGDVEKLSALKVKLRILGFAVELLDMKGPRPY